MSSRHLSGFAISALFATAFFSAGDVHSATLPTKGLSAFEATITADERSLSDNELLGKRIFEDTNLSEPRGLACASCHEPNKAFSGNNHSSIAGVAKGSKPNTFGERNAPTLTYAALIPPFGFVKDKDEEGKEEIKPVGGLMLDGDSDSLMLQPQGPLMNPLEMNNPTHRSIVNKVADSAYAPLMKKLYGNNAFVDTDEAFEHITIAIAAFENTPRFLPFDSKFDQVLAGNDDFTAQEKRGFELFKDPQKGNCIACHVGKEDSHDPHDWPFTDYTFDSVGFPRNTAIPHTKNPKYHDLGLCKSDDIKARAPKGFDIDGVCGAFRVPTLRNIALTAPYGHNGYFSTLRDIVKFYATRDTSPELWYPKDAKGHVRKFNDLPRAYIGNVNTKEVPYNRKAGEKPALNDEEIDAIVAFLNTLTDHSFVH